MLKNSIWENELQKLAQIVSKFPLEKKTKWGSDVFTYNGKNVVSYGGFKSYFSLWFFNGVFLKDKYNILVNAQEGKTKAMKQWRFYSMEEIDEKKISEYLIEAIEIEEKELKISPEKFEAIPLRASLKTHFFN